MLVNREIYNKCKHIQLALSVRIIVVRERREFERFNSLKFFILLILIIKNATLFLISNNFLVVTNKIFFLLVTIV